MRDCSFATSIILKKKKKINYSDNTHTHIHTFK